MLTNSNLNIVTLIAGAIVFALVIYMYRSKNDQSLTADFASKFTWAYYASIFGALIMVMIVIYTWMNKKNAAQIDAEDFLHQTENEMRRASRIAE